MSLELEVWNFQSFPYAKVFLDGFVTFTGDSGVGKSQLAYRALISLLYNVWDSKHYIRKGEKECIIKLSFLDAKDAVDYIQIEKPLNTYTVRYKSGVVNVHPKTDKTVPAEIQDLGFKLIKSERGDSFNLTFSWQFDGLFLMASEEVVTTSFLNSVFGISRYERALKAISSDITKFNSRYAEGELEVSGLRDELSANVKEKELKEATVSMVADRLKAVEELEKSLALVRDVSREYIELHRIESTILKCDMCQNEFRTIVGYIVGVLHSGLIDEYMVASRWSTLSKIKLSALMEYDALSCVVDGLSLIQKNSYINFELMELDHRENELKNIQHGLNIVQNAYCATSDCGFMIKAFNMAKTLCGDWGVKFDGFNLFLMMVESILKKHSNLSDVEKAIKSKIDCKIAELNVTHPNIILSVVAEINSYLDDLTSTRKAIKSVDLSHSFTQILATLNSINFSLSEMELIYDSILEFSELNRLSDCNYRSMTMVETSESLYSMVDEIDGRVTSLSNLLVDVERIEGFSLTVQNSAMTERVCISVGEELEDRIHACCGKCPYCHSTL